MTYIVSHVDCDKATVVYGVPEHSGFRQDVDRQNYDLNSSYSLIFSVTSADFCSDFDIAFAKLSVKVHTTRHSARNNTATREMIKKKGETSTKSAIIN